MDFGLIAGEAKNTKIRSTKYQTERCRADSVCGNTRMISPSMRCIFSITIAQLQIEAKKL